MQETQANALFAKQITSQIQTLIKKDSPSERKSDAEFITALKNINGNKDTLKGDYNNDGTVDTIDEAILKVGFGSTTDLRADGNRDGIVNQADLDILLTNWGNGKKVETASSPSLTGLAYSKGDYNNDGIVDTIDEAILKVGFGSTTDLRADGNRDGIINQADLDLVLNNWGSTSRDALAPFIPALKEFVAENYPKTETSKEPGTLSKTTIIEHTVDFVVDKNGEPLVNPPVLNSTIKPQTAELKKSEPVQTNNTPSVDDENGLGHSILKWVQVSERAQINAFENNKIIETALKALNRGFTLENNNTDTFLSVFDE